MRTRSSLPILPIALSLSGVLLLTSCSGSDGQTGTGATSGPVPTSTAEGPPPSGPDGAGSTSEEGSGTPAGSASTTAPATTDGSGEEDATAGEAALERTDTPSAPPVGIPGGVPGAEPLSDTTVQALTAVLSAEGEVGGPVFRLARDGSGWLASVRVWDGAREVRVDEAGTTVESVTTTAVPEEEALALDSAVVPLPEAAEVGLAKVPGDLAGVRLVDSGGTWVWRVEVESAGGRATVDVDPGRGVVVGSTSR
ncbi:hypothetical protein GCM10009584_10220 [Ornithinimicrobium humiphilum]|uniref:PepSY domain-containing protein n=1 Tax=Ornithinimicrobium humiphilum TaxID=125288 RepID=A0A543KR34_9MICO|nr:hypothetical protein [Ornithinimicrobium humiphilum]TQM97531.1 hypothetical protein FB476_2444 [Ornithinimicrobium humiphilum]